MIAEAPLASSERLELVQFLLRLVRLALQPVQAVGEVPHGGTPAAAFDPQDQSPPEAVLRLLTEVLRVQTDRFHREPPRQGDSGEHGSGVEAPQVGRGVVLGGVAHEVVHERQLRRPASEFG